MTKTICHYNDESFINFLEPFVHVYESTSIINKISESLSGLVQHLTHAYVTGTYNFSGDENASCDKKSSKLPAPPPRINVVTLKNIFL